MAEVETANGDGAGSQVVVEQLAGPDDALVLKVTGEVDLSSVDSLRAKVEQGLQQQPSKVVFELSDLRFMDSSGIALMLTVAVQVAAFELHNPTPMVRRVVELSGLTTTLRITP